MKCQYQDHGCEVELIRNKLKNHEKNCTFVPVQCPDINCFTRVPISEVIDHLSTNTHFIDKALDGSSTHEQHILMNHEISDTRYIWKDFNIKVIQLELDGKLFFLEIFREARDGFWLFWVYFVGSQKEAMDYNYTITIKSENEVSYF